MRVQVADRVGVEPAPVAVDRGAHGCRMRREVEAAELDDARVVAERAPHLRPTTGVRGRRRSVGQLLQIGEPSGAPAAASAAPVRTRKARRSSPAIDKSLATMAATTFHRFVGKWALRARFF